jgi:hypothetical protein
MFDGDACLENRTHNSIELIYKKKMHYGQLLHEFHFTCVCVKMSVWLNGNTNLLRVEINASKQLDVLALEGDTS